VSERDFYEVLGIGRDADLSAIKKAYRRLALQHHPDRNPGDAQAEERFKEAAEAYAVLSDPDKRRRYDQYGRAGVGGQGGFRGFDQEIFADFGDILGDLFGLGGIFGGAGRRRRQAGADLEYELRLTFEQAVRGTQTQIQVPRLEACGTCAGRGAAEGGVKNCAQCNGRGQVAFQQGFFTIARTCGQCRGTGRRITKPCPDCRGEGRVRTERSISLRVPPGVDEGMRLRLSGEGEASAQGGPPGDLYVTLSVEPHATLRRNGQDLESTLELSFAEAALGSERRVATIDGDRALKVPAGTQSGTRVRLRGLGVAALNGGSRGDHWVVLQVRTPTELGADQRALFERLREIEGQASPGRGVFERVKDIFS